LDKNIKAIIRGHLFSIGKKAISLKESSDELYRTHFWSIIIGDREVSFKKDKEVLRFKYNELKKFYLENSEVFIFVKLNEKKKYYMKVV